MATQAEIEAAAKAIFLAATYHDQFAATWDSATHNQKVFACAYANVALAAAEKVRAES